MPLSLLSDHPLSEKLADVCVIIGWETIFFLSIWARQAAETPGRRAVTMYATKYPFYFDVDTAGKYLNIGDAGDKKPMLSTKAFDELKHGKILQAFLQEAYSKFRG